MPPTTCTLKSLFWAADAIAATLVAAAAVATAVAHQKKEMRAASLNNNCMHLRLSDVLIFWVNFVDFYLIFERFARVGT